MRIDIVTILPGLLEGPFRDSIIKRAREKGLVEIHIVNLRDFATGKHRQVDDYAYGGGAGMVMMAEPFAACIESLQAARNYDAVVYMTPDGEKFDQKMANRFSTMNNLMLLCGHYKGIDQRIRDIYVTHEVSIGDYVLSGGELAACVFSDAIIRLIPGVLGDETSALSDSFQDDLLAPAVYTRPPVFKGISVPEVLLSGHASNIEKWRMNSALERTRLRRPDLLD